MKVLMINGSSRNNGCTRAALDIMAETFKEEGIETEIIFIGNQPIADCMNCKKCVTEHQCVFDDVVNEITTKAKDCDGFIFASPVYYAHPSARRAGQVASMDVVNKHFSISHMPIVSANYWNEVFGSEPEDVYKDAEGIATMQNIAKNMSWLLKSIEAGKKAGLERPELSTGHTNFHH